LTVTEYCGESHLLTFRVGEGNIYFLAAREEVSENDYRVLDFTFTGLGTDKASWEILEDMNDRVIEFTYFEATDATYGNGATTSQEFDLSTLINIQNFADNSCGCSAPFLEKEDTKACV